MFCVRVCKVFKGKKFCFYCLLGIAILSITLVFADTPVAFGFINVYFSTQDGRPKGGMCCATREKNQLLTHSLCEGDSG